MVQLRPGINHLNQAKADKKNFELFLIQGRGIPPSPDIFIERGGNLLKIIKRLQYFMREGLK
jgi:hypothetical protein